jgi:hypothetical protein
MRRRVANGKAETSGLSAANLWRLGGIHPACCSAHCANERQERDVPAPATVCPQFGEHAMKVARH